MYATIGAGCDGPPCTRSSIVEDGDDSRRMALNGLATETDIHPVCRFTF